jgi:hypothetical protein
MLDNKDIEKLIEVLATKDDLEKSEQKLEDKIVEFKSEILTGHDEILKELKALRQEKTVADAQDKRKTEILKIHNNVLKSKKILSDSEVGQIEKLHAF